MRQYLQDVIATQSSRRQERIYALLEEARVGKQQLNVLFDRLRGAVAGNSPLQMSTEEEGRFITTGPTTNNLRQIGLRIAEMYRLSNLISLLLNSHVSVLSSEVKGIEEELATMEKMISNYAFLLSDAKAFDYAYLEPFNNYAKMEEDITQRAPDRSGSYFGPTHTARIHKNEGVLTLPTVRTVSFNTYPRIISSNHQVHLEGLSDTVKQDSTRGWKSEFISPSPIRSSIPGTSADPGAQVVLEYELTEPQAASHVGISPFSNIPMYLESVKVFLSEAGSDPVDLLDEPVLLDRDIELSFPLETVSRFQIHINQRTFTRTFDVDSVETQTRTLLGKLSERSRDRTIHEIETRLLKTAIIKRPVSFGSRDFSESLSNISDLTKVSLGVPLQRILWDGLESFYDSQERLSQAITDSQSLIRQRVIPSLLQDAESSIEIKIPPPTPTVEKDGYRYILGLKTVTLGLHNPSFKGVFISSPLDAEGDIGEIRLKVGENQYISTDRSLHNRQLTSTEYSISNKPSPVAEIDWKPILPIGESSVVSERLFPNEFGAATFRIPADRQEIVQVYKNGVNFSRYTFSYAIDNSITGINIPIKRLDANDIFTVDYTPQTEATTIKLNEISNFEDLPLTAAFDSSGAGEFFERTHEKNTVTLTHVPYIDRNRVSESSYSPVSVIPEDGKPAINLTDYTKSNTVEFPGDENEESYYYIHSGRKLLFNKPILDGVRIFYQYLETNVRFRVVLRCNTQDFVSPKVDYVHAKAKIRKPDQNL